MEGNGLGLDFTFFNINLVSSQNDRNVLADTDKITMPVRDVLVCDTRCNIKHDNRALSLNANREIRVSFQSLKSSGTNEKKRRVNVLVTITKTTKLFLTSGIPGVEANSTEVGVESKRVNLNTEGGNVFLLEFSGQMALDEAAIL